MCGSQLRTVRSTGVAVSRMETLRGGAMANRSFSKRWVTPEGQKLANEVLARLVVGKTLAGLPLDVYDGRVDLRGLVAPPPTAARTFSTRRWLVRELGDLWEFRGVRLDRLDFSGAQLDHWRFTQCSITNCRFDNARCRDWRLWCVDISNTSLAAIDLRSAALGTWYKGRGNVYQRCNFARADLRGIGVHSATFIDCDFLEARLDKVEFVSCSMVRCRFSGLLREVIFYGPGFGEGKLKTDPLEDVDFTQADLQWVGFRALNLDRVALPSNELHLLVKHYRCTLRKSLVAIGQEQSERSLVLRAFLEDCLKWAGPRQEIGVVSWHDFLEVLDQDGARYCIELIRRSEAECANSSV
jgi:uncharacterized protein YjbI with pentapeptide repeats